MRPSGGEKKGPSALSRPNYLLLAEEDLISLVGDGDVQAFVVLYDLPQQP